MEFVVDKRIYNESCIAKAVYSLAPKYVIERKFRNDAEECWYCNLSDIKNEDEAKSAFIQTLNDFRLRCIIEAETHDIRTILYAKAFEDCEEISETDLD